MKGHLIPLMEKFALMHSMITVVALLNAVTNVSEKPNWQADYKAAMTAVSQSSKPMAVFVGAGVDGWTKVAKEAALNKDVLELLKDKYVCMYVNTETTTGKTLADTLEIKSGIVISDAKGAKQAFSHEGSLSQDDLKLALVRYSDATRVANTTETLAMVKAPARTTTPSYVVSGCANGQCGAPSYSSYPATGSPVGYPTNYGYPAGYGIPAQGNCPNGRCPNR